MTYSLGVSNLVKTPLEQRKEILSYIEKFLEPHPHVYALWLEDADARNKVDEFSDIDLWLGVEDEHEENVLRELEQHLKNLATLDMVYKKSHPHPQIRQWFFHLANTSEFLILDVCVQSHSRKAACGKGDAVKVLFDKAQVIRFEDEKINVLERAGAIREEVALYKLWVLKAIKRGQWLEAISYYHEHILQPLVTVLRLKYTPDKTDYDFKHVDEDLPADVVAKLETLTKIISWEGLEAHLDQAVSWLEAIVKEIELKHES